MKNRIERRLYEHAEIMIQLHIREDELTRMEIASFLQNHLDEMHEITPPESVHALDLAALNPPQITFWSAWADSELVGSGALKELDHHTGEIKSMRTAKVHRGKGVGSAMLEHIIQEAERRTYQRLYLETGAMPEFAPARALYTRYGFVFRGPFAKHRRSQQCLYDQNTVECSEHNQLAIEEV